MSSHEFLPGPQDRTVRSPSGEILQVPEGWTLVAPGDPALTRRLKAAGEYWAVQGKKGRKIFSRGIWAPQENVTRILADLEQERSQESYTRRREADSRRRAFAQEEYVAEFYQSVLTYLNFHERYLSLSRELARRVTVHATPVGSGTVARTQRIPVEQRAEAAVIAWLRHQTTGYDNMVVPRVKGARREIRRMLAQRSKELLSRYRRGEPIPEDCPLQQTLRIPPNESENTTL